MSNQSASLEKSVLEVQEPSSGNSKVEEAAQHHPTIEVKGKGKSQGSPNVTVSLPEQNEHVVVTSRLHSRLDAFFPSENCTEPYSDEQIHQISLLLNHTKPQWSKVPRCYIILRQIVSLDILEDCISIGFSDYWLPATTRNLPDCMRPSIKVAFVEAQDLILIKALGLERGAKGRHCYFKKGATIPFETKAVLGSGGYGQVDRVLSLVSYK